MPRYKIVLEYDGATFVGWQRQANGLSVQERLENAIAAFAGESARVTGAGRTDAGVHACGQCAHFDLARPFPPETVRDALNAHLRPEPVAVLTAAFAPDRFDARFDARERHYLYRIVNRRSPLALERGRAWHVAHDLDAAAMQAAACALIGHHDFSSFRAAECQARTAIKTLDRLDVAREGDAIAIEARARSFLHNQVRIMVGTLALVGAGKWAPEAVGAALAARARERAGPTAPADGLYLMRVVY